MGQKGNQGANAGRNGKKFEDEVQLQILETINNIPQTAYGKPPKVKRYGKRRWSKHDGGIYFKEKVLLTVECKKQVGGGSALDRNFRYLDDANDFKDPFNVLLFGGDFYDREVPGYIEHFKLLCKKKSDEMGVQIYALRDNEEWTEFLEGLKRYMELS